MSIIFGTIDFLIIPLQYYLHAMQCAIPGERDKIFSTVGKPKVW